MNANEHLPPELNALMETIATSFEAASEALPTSAPLAQNGLSLLDLKNVLLLSYLQQLSLLTLSKLDNASFSIQTPKAQEIVWKLIQDRVHLEKGVFPLETKIGYEVRKLLRAAEDISRSKDEQAELKPSMSDLPPDSTETVDKSGVYKPPRIAATAMSTNRGEDGPRRNRVLEEFISQSALSAAPSTLPSVGSNVAGIGARNTYKTSRNKDVEQYEEENFIRLPANIGKEKQKGRKPKGPTMEGYGGEDWSGLDRIGRGSWNFSKQEGKVEKSRKRHMEDDGPREDITGKAFEKRKKTLQDRKLKKKRRG